jgi:hypothetical protein
LDTYYPEKTSRNGYISPAKRGVSCGAQPIGPWGAWAAQARRCGPVPVAPASHVPREPPSWGEGGARSARLAAGASWREPWADTVTHRRRLAPLAVEMPQRSVVSSGGSRRPTASSPGPVALPHRAPGSRGGAPHRRGAAPTAALPRRPGPPRATAGRAWSPPPLASTIGGARGPRASRAASRLPCSTGPARRLGPRRAPATCRAWACRPGHPSGRGRPALHARVGPLPRTYDSRRHHPGAQASCARHQAPSGASIAM